MTLGWIAFGLCAALALILLGLLGLSAVRRANLEAGGAETGLLTRRAGLFALGFLAALLGARLPPRAIHRLDRWLGRLQAEVRETYDPPERRPVGYLCFRAFLDEAGLLLRFWSLFAWVMQTAIYTFIYGAAGCWRSAR